MSRQQQYDAVDIEDLNTKYDKILQEKINEPTIEDVSKWKDLVFELDKIENFTKLSLCQLKRKYHFQEKNGFLYQIYVMMVKNDLITFSEKMRNILITKRNKSASGVLVITIFTSPYPKFTKNGNIIRQEFSCKFNCFYCPNEPGMPRSYLKSEPGVLRGNRNNWDCVSQMHDRMNTLQKIGHYVDKLEVLVLGGTWTSYPLEYREEFVRDMYYAANTFNSLEKREKSSLDSEKRINVSSQTRVIGLTLETRPDTISKLELQRFRYYGCTRVQLGVQHINDDVLKKINRQCKHEKTVKAIEMLKNTGFKIDIHLMPNLPGSTKLMDTEMMAKFLGVAKKRSWYPIKSVFLNMIWGNSLEYPLEFFEKYELSNPELQADQWKIYPMAVTPYSKVAEWFLSGEYTGYSSQDLQDVLLETKTNMFPWIRLNRIIRDITSDYIISSSDHPSLRNDLAKILAEKNIYCKCIRCKEVKSKTLSDNIVLVTKEYNASSGTEFFLSFESDDFSIIYGFCRLRLCKPDTLVFPELQDSALIRELHVYGEMINVGDNRQGNSQHKGFGKKLMAKAESIARNHHYSKISVISGNGVKPYYEKLGYREDFSSGNFMIKQLCK